MKARAVIPLSEHSMRAEWAGTRFPCVPGYEIVGRVSSVGAQVSGFTVGNLVSVGCIADSCKHCDADMELIRGDQINGSYERLLKGDVKYRLVIDNAILAG